MLVITLRTGAAVRPRPGWSAIRMPTTKAGGAPAPAASSTAREGRSAPPDGEAVPGTTSARRATRAGRDRGRAREQDDDHDRTDGQRRQVEAEPPVPLVGAGGAQRRDDREDGGGDHRDRGRRRRPPSGRGADPTRGAGRGSCRARQLGQVRLVELDLAADGLPGEQRDDGQQDQPEQPDGDDLGSEEGPSVPEPVPAGRDHRLEVVGGRHVGDLAAEALQPAGSVAQGDVLHEVAERVRMAVEERRA